MLSIPLDEVVTPGLVIKVAGEGLPLPTQGGGQQLKVCYRYSQRADAFAVCGWQYSQTRQLASIFLIVARLA